MKLLKKFLSVLTFLFVILFCTYSFFARPYEIVAPSYLLTSGVENKQIVLVNKITYFLREPKKYDPIIFTEDDSLHNYGLLVEQLDYNKYKVIHGQQLKTINTDNIIGHVWYPPITETEVDRVYEDPNLVERINDINTWPDKGLK